MDNPSQHHSIRRAMRVIYPALLVAWLAFPGLVRDWASEQAAQGWLPQAVLPLFETALAVSDRLGIAPTMQDWHDRLNARLDARIR